MLVDDEVGLGSLHGHLGIVHLVGDAVTHQSLGVTEERRGRTTKDLVHLVLSTPPNQSLDTTAHGLPED